MTDILLPELGEGISDVEIRDVLVSKGDHLKKDQIILILETDKASMEIPSEYDGVISEVYVKTGDKISPDDKILGLKGNDDSQKDIDTAQDNIQNEGNEGQETKEVEQVTKTNIISPPSETPSTDDTQSNVLASPSTRKLARELGCDISLIAGSGDKGRVSKEDILSYVNRYLSSNPSGVSSDDLKSILKDEISVMKDDILNELSNEEKSVSSDIDFSKWGLIETEPLNKIKQATGNNMSNAWTTIPQVTQFDSADISSLYKSYKNLSVHS